MLEHELIMRLEDRLREQDAEIEMLRTRLDAINNAVDDNEQTMLAMGKKLEDLQSDLDSISEAVDDNEQTMLAIAKRFENMDETAAPANEARHD